MKNILKNAENAEKLLELTSDTMILLDRNGICVDIAVNNADLWFLKENQLLGRNILQLLPSVTYRQVYPEFKKVLAYKEVSARNYELTIGSETYFFKCIMRPYEDMVLCQMEIQLRQAMLLLHRSLRCNVHCRGTGNSAPGLYYVHPARG